MSQYVKEHDDIFVGYTDTTAMIADQANQVDQVIYAVADASDDPNITFAPSETRTYAYYQLRSNSTKTGSLSDYRLISAPYGNGGTGGTFDPNDYDLDEFNNASADPYIRNSNLPAPFDPTQLENDIQNLENNKQVKDLGLRYNI